MFGNRYEWGGNKPDGGCCSCNCGGSDAEASVGWGGKPRAKNVARDGVRI